MAVPVPLITDTSTSVMLHPPRLGHDNRTGDHTFQLFGEKHLHQEPEEEYDHDALDHPLAAEEHHRLPQGLPRVLLIMVGHDATGVLQASASKHLEQKCRCDVLQYFPGQSCTCGSINAIPWLLQRHLFPDVCCSNGKFGLEKENEPSVAAPHRFSQRRSQGDDLQMT